MLLTKATNLIFTLLLLCSSFSSLQATTRPGTTGEPIERFLNADGSLSFPEGFSGTLDTRGFSIHLDECEGPIALPMSGMWSPLGDGVSNNNFPFVYALAIGPSGELFVGGLFTEAGGQPANNIAKWDGATWSALGAGVSGGSFPRVRALAIGPSGELFAGGRFTEAGGQSARNIAKWDGMSWSPLGAGVNNTVRALAIGPNGELFAGGFFSQAGGQPANFIAKWDGMSWSPLGAGTSFTVRALAIGPSGELFVGGNFTEAGGQPASGVAKWDGMSWSPLGAGTSSAVYALAIGPSGELFAGGFNSIATWDGATWSPLGAGVNGDVEALAIGPSGELFVGGNFTEAGGQPANFIAKWDGMSWSPLGAGVDLFVRALAIGPSGELFAGGDFSQAGGQPANNIAKFVPTTCDIEITSVDVTDETCAGDNDGSITINATCTTCTSILYSIDGGASTQTSPLFENLPDGTYMPYVEDSGDDDCNATASDVMVVMGGTIPAVPTPDRLTDAACKGSNATVRVDDPPANIAIHWLVVAAPMGATISTNDVLLPGQNTAEYRTNLDANARRLRIKNDGGVVAGLYQFRAKAVNTTTGCESAFTTEIFEINIYEQPTVDISADPDGDICLGTTGVQYDATIMSSDGGTYSYDWCAYNATNGGGTCFYGFTPGGDNAMQMRNWTSSSGPKSVGVTVTSTVSGCSASDIYDFTVNTNPPDPIPATAMKEFCEDSDLAPSLANTGINVSNTLTTDEKVVWVLTGKPDGSAYTVGDLFTTDNCGDAFKNFGELAVANTSKAIRVNDPANAPAGTYTFDAYIENCVTGCTSTLVAGFSIMVNPLPAPPVPAQTDNEFCEGDALAPNLANTGVSVGNTLSANETVVWILTGAPVSSGLDIDDEFEASGCATGFNNYGLLAVANSSRVIRIEDPANAPVGDYTFEAIVENCVTGCRSAAVGSFTITVNPLPAPPVPATATKEFCEGSDLSPSLPIRVSMSATPSPPMRRSSGY
jgi:hypothetical protein